MKNVFSAAIAATALCCYAPKALAQAILVDKIGNPVNCVAYSANEGAYIVSPGYFIVGNNGALCIPVIKTDDLSEEQKRKIIEMQTIEKKDCYGLPPLSRPQHCR
jgi:hypothetical protein